MIGVMVVYIGVASAVKVEMKGKDCFSWCPYMYMGRYGLKERKNRRKLYFFLCRLCEVLYGYCKINL